MFVPLRCQGDSTRIRLFSSFPPRSHSAQSCHYLNSINGEAFARLLGVQKAQDQGSCPVELLTTRSANHVQCDQRKQGGCSNCAKFGVQCPGYRSQIDISLRDEIAKTVIKYRSDAANTEKASGSWSSLQATGSLNNLAPTVNQDIDDLSLRLFYSMHCMLDFTRWPTDRLRGIGNGCLFAAAKVLGLEAMEQAPHPSQANGYMQRQYVEAIRLLNEALESASESREDYAHSDDDHERHRTKGRASALD